MSAPFAIWLIGTVMQFVGLFSKGELAKHLFLGGSIIVLARVSLGIIQS